MLHSTAIAKNQRRLNRMDVAMFVLLLIPSLMFVSLFIALGAVAFSSDSNVLEEASTEPSFELAA